MIELETILLATLPLLDAAAATVIGATGVVTRNQSVAERMEADDAYWLNLLDGAPDGPPDACMGDGYDFTHVARVMIGVRGDSDADRDARFAALVKAINTAAIADETLGGLVDLMQVQPVEAPDAEILDLTVGFKVGELPILFLYTAPTAAG
ncbi:hypothetical protein sos41_11850 [Alphaproteobacteria bacterium SO-S41]|nr:hypothetical protein sos41_11850 [Alphaproteobacteria bacterium SO-S41]